MKGMKIHFGLPIAGLLKDVRGIEKKTGWNGLRVIVCQGARVCSGNSLKSETSFWRQMSLGVLPA
jgi:hypothetical protein